MQVPDIREGDTLQPGMPVADVLDLSEFEVVARVGELDRANLHEGQDVTIQLDAVPDKKFHGKIKSMSGSASANIFSGDPGKKFDVVFSIDMQRLLAALGAKPEEIQRILETAAQNSKKAPPTPPGGAMMAFGPGGPPAGGGVAGGGGTAGGGQQMRVVMQAPPAQAAKPSAGKAGAPVTGERRTSAAGTGMASMPAPTTEPGGAGGMDFTRAAVAGQGTEEERAHAQLPPPPEEDSQLKVLLRPGLLADVEITIEKIPNSIHIPAQSVFEKDGKPVVYVQAGSHYQPRFVKLARRSESTMVISEGLKPGEVVALADPFAKPNQKNAGKKGPAALPGVPAGGAKGGK